MSRRVENTPDRRREEGSLPLALLAAIVIAGIVSVLLARVVAGERAARFDRDYSDALQTADVGINRGLFALNEGLVPPGASSYPASAPAPTQIGDIDYDWSLTRTGTAQWEITSRSMTPSGVSRLLVATATEDPLFVQGAFADRPLALNGTSSQLDSYNSSVSCGSNCWGDPGTTFGQKYGTGNATIGSNEQLDLSGQPQIPPGSGFLYDWAANPGEGSPAPFGKRLVEGALDDACVVTAGTKTRCTTEYVRTVLDPHSMSLPERTQFVTDMFETGECSDPGSAHWLPSGQIGDRRNDPPVALRSYATQAGIGSDPGPNTPVQDGFVNFFCVEDLSFKTNVVLSHEVTVDNPVIYFVKNKLTVDQSLSIACHNFSATTTPPDSNCDADSISNAANRTIRPQASRLQIYVAGLGDADIEMGNGEFAGVVFAPRSNCSNGGGAHFFGAMMCRTIDHRGFWSFHYDDALGTFGSGYYSVARWEERAP